MHLKRATFGKDIVGEFLPPRKPSSKVIIFLDGMPSSPGTNKSRALFFCKKGYWFINPRYHGAWESGGEFLVQDPTSVVDEVIGQVSSGITSVWDGEKHKIKNPTYYVVGTSFGGTAAILSSSNNKIQKCISISGVVDWNAENTDEPLDKLYTIIKQAYGMGYRLNKKNWDKLGKQGFYNPVTSPKKINKNKLLMIHAVDDTIVSYDPIKTFSKKHNIPLITVKKGGHISSKILTGWLMWKRVNHFLKQ